MYYVFKREAASYFSTPFGFVFMGIFLILGGLVFTSYNLLGGNGDMSGTFGLFSRMSFMTFPVLTMRLFSEERRGGTEQLLLTSRLRIFDIVVGKYLAALFVFFMSLLVTGVYVVMIARYGFPNLGGILASYVGYFVLGAAMIAVCTFASSLSENQVTAAIVSFGMLFTLVMLSSFGRSLTIPVVSQVLSALSLIVRYDEFIRGIFRLGPICYYIGFSVVFIYFAMISLEHRRYQ